jgi:hypothetical protein
VEVKHLRVAVDLVEVSGGEGAGAGGSPRHGPMIVPRDRGITTPILRRDP